jgi:TM2 domain-containing membrane protein YozV
MATLADLFHLPKNRKVAIALALFGTILLLPFPIAGLHKFYLGQPLWGVIYLLLWQTPIPRIACAIDAVLYFIQDSEQFAQRFNLTDSITPALNAGRQVGSIAEAMRELDQLRVDGLISEYEFEQKRRQLLEKII